MASLAIVGGAGYVGLTYAAAFAARDHDVLSLDIDAAKISALSTGQSPIFEPGLDDLLAAGVESGKLRFTTDYAEAIPAADFVFICVGTPSDANGRAEMSFVLAAARNIAQHAQGHTIVVNKSTLPVGSVQRVVDVLAEHGRPGTSFDVVSNPEFLREGAALQDVFRPDRIILGADDPAAARRVAGLYASWDAPVIVTDPRSAEMIKYASNAFLATKISFINEVAQICERVGADVSAVSFGMGLDERIGPRFLQAGAGFGGSCFPKDVRALTTMARDTGIDTTMLNAVLAINAAARRHVLDAVLDRLERQSQLNGWREPRVAVLGLAFKPDTDDIRESPALDIIAGLQAAGVTVRASDPVVRQDASTSLSQVEVFDDAYAAAAGADAVVLMTEWTSYLSLDFDHLANAMRGRFLFDARNALDPALVMAAGLDYLGVGRSRPVTADLIAADLMSPVEQAASAAD